MTVCSEPADAQKKGRHDAFIKSRVSETFKTATITRGLALQASPARIESWYTTAAPANLKRLAAANLKAWESQNRVDHLLSKIDLTAFATPLLQTKLKERYGIETTTGTCSDSDIENIWLRLYLPKEKPWYALNLSEGVTTRTVSLLDAALHNFAESETVGAGSDFISKPDAIGNFDVLPIKHKMTISQFQALCRELDIGAQYKKHLESYLLPGEPVSEELLKSRVIESQKDALTVAAELALATGDIQYDAYKMMLELNRDKPLLMLNGRKMRCYDLSMLDTRLTGIVLLFPAATEGTKITRMIAYVPHDPDHPLKEYASPVDFSIELARQLREDKFIASTKQTYRQFFSQFVDQQQRGHFFAELEQRLFVVRYHPRENPTDQRPAWRKDPVPRPNLQFKRVVTADDYWRHAYQQKLNKILNDARELAVPTADADSNARWAWWDNFKKILSDIFNVALLIATPFVPGLGELMMAYTVYQLTTDVIEGIVDLAEGLWQEAAEHVISVVTDAIQLAAFAAGAQIGNSFRSRLSPLVEGMKPVKLPDGKPSLWHPDLGPYEQRNLSLPSTAKPDRYGLHQHLDQSVLPLEGKLFIVEKASADPASNTHRIQHPSRPNAYRPEVEHNGHGAWVHEAENPQDWAGPTLMRRLGHSVERFSPSELEQIRISSGTDENALRGMHIDNRPPPPLLADTIKRFSVDDDVSVASAYIRKGLPLAPDAVWFEPFLSRLPGWPRSKALEVFDDASLTGMSRKYGNPVATEADTLRISLADVTNGRLPEHVMFFLDDGDLKVLLERDVPRAERAQALRDALANAVDNSRRDVASFLYQGTERSKKVDVGLMKQTFPDLPLTLAEDLLGRASSAELQRMVDENRLPLRLKTQAREADFEARASRAYDGFYRDEWMTPNTEKLALRTMHLEYDTFGDVRIDVRDGTHDGPLRCSVGPEDAATVRQLIRDENGQYELLDSDNRRLYHPVDFYEGILRALPEKQLTALGYRRGHGRLLKQWIMEKSAEPAERRTALAEPPIRMVVPRETEHAVRGWPWFFGNKTLEQEIRQLYPALSERQVNRFAEALRAKSDPDAAVRQLKDELKALRNTLSDWRDSQPLALNSAGSWDFVANGGQYLEEQLIECFERKSEAFTEGVVHPEQGYTLDLSTDMARFNIDRWWSQMRQRPGMKKYLEQITALKIDNRPFSVDRNGLLGDLPRLRQLRARQCGLRQIPPALSEMRQLESLDLTDNHIHLNEDSASRLSGLTRLESLRLTGNPLGQPPDIGRMYRLNELSLANSDIQDWPRGLFRVGNARRQRPRGLALDLRRSQVTTLPEVSPGSDEAFILARARFDTERLADADRTRYGDYRQSVGFTRQQPYSRAVENEIRHWLPAESSVFSPSKAFNRYREQSWQDLMNEPGSGGFFSVIMRLRQSEDFQSTGSRRRLTRRVWEMIDAVALDAELRTELFQQAREPVGCQDGGAQLFNSMGLKVLVSKAYAEQTSAKVLDDNLVRLARSAARLERVGDLAREEIGRQQQRNLIAPSNHLPPDDVEVHLAFENGLAERLELPWQSEGMSYAERSGVDQTMIDNAYDTIIRREQGDGLLNGMIDLYADDFWERHLRRTHPTQFEHNDRFFELQSDRLIELQTLQAQWAAATAQSHTPPQMNMLIRRMQELALELNINQADVFSGEPMSEGRYGRYVDELGDRRKALARRLTREALARAGLGA